MLLKSKQVGVGWGWGQAETPHQDTAGEVAAGLGEDSFSYSAPNPPAPPGPGSGIAPTSPHPFSGCIFSFAGHTHTGRGSPWRSPACVSGTEAQQGAVLQDPAQLSPRKGHWVPEAGVVARGQGKQCKPRLVREGRDLLKDFRLIPTSISAGTRDPNVEVTQPGPTLRASLQDWPRGATPEPCLWLPPGKGTWQPAPLSNGAWPHPLLHVPHPSL